MKGILFVATGHKCCLEAIVNAKRSLRCDDDVPIAIQTDEVQQAKESGIFDLVLPFEAPRHSYRDKVVGLGNLPYSKTLFLDSDACLIGSSRPLFELLRGGDIAAVQAPVRHPPGWSDSSVPAFFPELNTGVLLVRRSEAIADLFAAWLELYDQLFDHFQQSWDQASFRSVLWKRMVKQKLRFVPLPPESNLRTTKPWFAGRGLPVQVIHGRFPDAEFAPFVDYLNSDIDCFRTWERWLQLFPDTQIRPRYDRTFG